MKVGADGQITIPQGILDQAGLGPDTEVEIEVREGDVVLKRSVPTGSTSNEKLLQNLGQWRGRCGERFAAMGYTSVDEFIEDVRGR